MSAPNTTKVVTCKDCGHIGVPKIRLSGKVFLLIPAVFFGLLVTVANFVIGVILFVVGYFYMRVNTCTACGSENVEVVPSAADVTLPSQDQGVAKELIEAAGDAHTARDDQTTPSIDLLKPAKPSAHKHKGVGGKLVACKECGNEISPKAEVCPKCGFRYRASKQANSGPGFIVSLFKLAGGVIGAVAGMMIAVWYFSNGNLISPSQLFGSGSDSVTPARKLEISCEEMSRTLPAGEDRNAAFEACIRGGLSAIRAQERIKAERQSANQ